MSQPKIDLDFFETVIAYNCFKGNSEYLAAVSDYLEPRYFHNPNIRPIVQIINEFYKQHDVLPTPVEIKARLYNAELRTAFINTVNSFREVAGNFNESELLANTEVFFKNRMILKTVDDIIHQHSTAQGIDTDKIFEQLDHAHSITMLEDMGMDYFEAIDAHIANLKETERFMPTGWKWLDDKLGGGWMEQGRALYVFSGVTNVGKSIFLGNVACHALVEDKVVVLISLEMSEHVYAKRIDAQLSKIALSKLATETDQLKDFVGRFKKDRCKSKLIIKEFPPSTVNSRHISAFIKKLIRRGIKPDMIVIDYLSLLEPIHVTGSSYSDVKKISEQVRALSYIFHCPVISATQLNRDAFGVENPGIETTSESMGLAHTVDAQFAIWCGEEDAQLNIINLGLMKNRFGPKIGSTQLFIDYETLSLYEEKLVTSDNGMNDLLESTINQSLSKASGVGGTILQL